MSGDAKARSLMAVGVNGNADTVLAGTAVNIPTTKIEAAAFGLFLIGFPFLCLPAK
jgi:hypothetical protein